MVVTTQDRLNDESVWWNEMSWKSRKRVYEVLDGDESREVTAVLDPRTPRSVWKIL